MWHQLTQVHDVASCVVYVMCVYSVSDIYAMILRHFQLVVSLKTEQLMIHYLALHPALQRAS